MTNLAIRTQGLTRAYKYRTIRRELKVVQALAGVDMQVQRGELFGLLGPNGAGKTTVIKILTTLLAPTAGQAWIEGLDVMRDYRRIRPLINMVAGGESTGYGLLTVRENLWMFAQFYGLDFETTRRRTDDLLAMLTLSDQGNTKVSNLSTGMRQKMNFARGFITDPQIIFLDEPTLGLDVSAARDVRRYVKEWTTRAGKTTLLTTHYMAEADELCDRIAIISKGRIIACDSPAALKRQLHSESVFELRITGGHCDGLATRIGQLSGVRKATGSPRDGYTQLDLILDDESAIGPIITTLSGDGARILNLAKREPTLEDVFVALVGAGLEDAEVE